MNNKIGFVVWGIRNGFRNNWLSSNVDERIYGSLTDDMRQICNSTVDKFFSIEKIDTATVLSIYNPNTKDHVQRKAYMALSIVVPNGSSIAGDVIACLEAMMQTYEIKQGNAMVNMVNENDLKVQLDSLQLRVEQAAAVSSDKQMGVFNYSDTAQIATHFNNPSIFGFNKVFFISGQNIALERIPGIQVVQSFAKPLYLTVSDFDPNRHSVTINNQPITMTRMTVKQGDNVRMADIKTGQSKSFQITNRDEHISLREAFPPIYQQPRKPTSNNRNKIVALLSFAVIAVGAIVYFSMPSSEEGGTVGAADGTSGATSLITATYDFNKLELRNFPEEIDGSTQFYLYKLNQQSAWDTVSKDASESKVQLQRLTDTLIEIRYTLEGKKQIEKVRVTFKIPNKHKVKSGQSLSDIAEIYGINADSLAKWNRITDINKIQQDKELDLKPKIAHTSGPGEGGPGVVAPNTEASKTNTVIADAPAKTEKVNNNDDLTQLRSRIKNQIMQLQNQTDKDIYNKKLEKFKDNKSELESIEKEIKYKPKI